MPTTRVFTVPDSMDGRIVEHLGGAADQGVILERVGPVEFYRAVGYLSTWNLTYPHVRLYYNARELEITASYYDAFGGLCYCIGAVFNTTTNQFGFHS